ncbi:MAG: hypothetical protein PHT61_07975, partial [Candidatus Cloacimonetes bacterium]|nr:hypothetical protein [Candidatus Cloacimonadota bacterium]
QVQVVSTLLLKGKKQIYKVCFGDSVPMPFPTDQIVLAEHTAQIAIREKNGSATSGTGNGGLFTEMQLSQIDLELSRCLTETSL